MASLLQVIKNKKLTREQHAFAEKVFGIMYDETTATSGSESKVLNASQLKHLLCSIGFENTTKEAARVRRIVK